METDTKLLAEDTQEVMLMYEMHMHISRDHVSAFHTTILNIFIGF